MNFDLTQRDSTDEDVVDVLEVDLPAFVPWEDVSSHGSAQPRPRRLRLVVIHRV